MCMAGISVQNLCQMLPSMSCLCLLILGFVGWVGEVFGILRHNSYWIYRCKVFLGPLMPATDIAIATCHSF